MVGREKDWREQWGRMNKKDRSLVHKNVTMSLIACMIIQTLKIKKMIHAANTLAVYFLLADIPSNSSL